MTLTRTMVMLMVMIMMVSMSMIMIMVSLISYHCQHRLWLSVSQAVCQYVSSVSVSCTFTKKTLLYLPVVVASKSPGVFLE